MNVIALLVLGTVLVFSGSVLGVGTLLSDHVKFSFVKSILFIAPWFLIVTAWANYLV